MKVLAAIVIMAAFALAWLALSCPAAAQSVVCWYVPNGLNVTLQCANGYWQTMTPEGEVYTGNGMTDPSATARGSSIPLDGPAGRRGLVSPPTQILPMLEPGQANSYGFAPRQD